MKKNLHFEIIRAVSCILVIAIHVSNIYNRSFSDLSQFSYWTALLVNAVARISVPLFFMISGALLAGRKPELKKSLHRVRKYLLVTAVWFLFYLVWTTTYLQTPYSFRKVLATPPSTHLWFLYAILAIYMALPLIQALVRQLTPALTVWLLVLLGIAVGGEYILSFTPLDAKYGIPLVSEGRYFTSFFLGYVLFQYRDKIKLRTRTLIAVLVASCLACVLLTGGATLLEGTHNEHFFEYRNPLIFVESAVAFLLFQRIPRLSETLTRVVTHISGNSFGIYLLHAVFLNILHKEFPMVAWPAVLGIPVYTFGIFLVTDVLVTLLRKVKGVRYFF